VVTLTIPACHGTISIVEHREGERLRAISPFLPAKLGKISLIDYRGGERE